MDAKVHHAIANLKDSLKSFDFILCIRDQSQQNYWSCSSERVKEDLEHKGGVLFSEVDVILDEEGDSRAAKSDSRKSLHHSNQNLGNRGSCAASSSSTAYGDNRGRPDTSWPQLAPHASSSSSTSMVKTQSSASSSSANEVTPLSRSSAVSDSFSGSARRHDGGRNRIGQNSPQSSSIPSPKNPCNERSDDKQARILALASNRRDQPTSSIICDTRDTRVSNDNSNNNNNRSDDDDNDDNSNDQHKNDIHRNKTTSNNDRVITSDNNDRGKDSCRGGRNYEGVQNQDGDDRFRHNERQRPAESFPTVYSQIPTRFLTFENLDADLHEEPLRFLLQECGRLERLSYNEGKDGGARVARIQYRDVDDAKHAFQKYDGRKLGKKLKIKVAFCDSFTDDEEESQESRYSQGRRSRESRGKQLHDSEDRPDERDGHDESKNRSDSCYVRENERSDISISGKARQENGTTMVTSAKNYQHNDGELRDTSCVSKDKNKLVPCGKKRPGSIDRLETRETRHDNKSDGRSNADQSIIPNSNSKEDRSRRSERYEESNTAKKQDERQFDTSKNCRMDRLDKQNHEVSNSKARLDRSRHRDDAKQGDKTDSLAEKPTFDRRLVISGKPIGSRNVVITPKDGDSDQLHENANSRMQDSNRSRSRNEDTSTKHRRSREGSEDLSSRRFSVQSPQKDREKSKSYYSVREDEQFTGDTDLRTEIVEPRTPGGRSTNLPSCNTWEKPNDERGKNSNNASPCPDSPRASRKSKDTVSDQRTISSSKDESTPGKENSLFVNSFKPVESGEAEAESIKKSSHTRSDDVEEALPEEGKAVVKISSNKANSSPNLSLKMKLKDVTDVDLTDYEEYADEEEEEEQKISVINQHDVEGESDDDNDNDDSDDDDDGDTSDVSSREASSFRKSRSKSVSPPRKETVLSKRKSWPENEDLSVKKLKSESKSKLSASGASPESRKVIDTTDRSRASMDKFSIRPSSSATSTRNMSPSHKVADESRSRKRRQSTEEGKRKKLPKAYADYETCFKDEAERKWGKFHDAGERGHSKPDGCNAIGCAYNARQQFGSFDEAICNYTQGHHHSRSRHRKSSFSNEKSISAPFGSRGVRGSISKIGNNTYTDKISMDNVHRPSPLIRSFSAESVMDPRNRPNSSFHHHDRHRHNHPHPAKHNQNHNPSSATAIDIHGVQKPKHNRDDPAANRRVCIMNIDPDSLEGDFMNLINQYGVVEEVQVIRVSELTPRTRASVQYAREDQARNANEALWGQMFKQSRLYTCMGYAQPYLFHSDDPRVPMVPIVYVKGIRSEVDIRCVRAEFAKFGPIEDIRRSVDLPNARPVQVKGVFILYLTLEDAVEACLQLNGCAIKGLERDGSVDVTLFYSTRGREASTGIALVREFKNRKKTNFGGKIGEQAYAAKHNQQPAILPLPPSLSSTFLNEHQPQQKLQQPPQQPLISNQDVFPVQRSHDNRDKLDQSRYRRSCDRSFRNRLAPSTHQRSHPYQRDNGVNCSTSSDAISSRGTNHHQHQQHHSRRGKVSMSSKSSSSSALSQRGPTPMQLNRGVPTDVHILIELKDRVPKLCDAVFLHNKHMHPASLHLLHGDPLFVESILAAVKTTPSRVKILSLSDTFHFSEDSLLTLSVKLCLRMVPDTALLMGFRKEDICLGESLGKWRPLRYAVEDLKQSSSAASFEIDSVPNEGGVSKRIVVYIVPASRFSQLLKRSISTLDKTVMKENSTHFVIVALTKESDQLTMSNSQKLSARGDS